VVRQCIATAVVSVRVRPQAIDFRRMASAEGQRFPDLADTPRSRIVFTRVGGPRRQVNVEAGGSFTGAQ